MSAARAKASALDRRAFGDWIAQVIAPRNVAGLADPGRHNLYPVDFDVLMDRHELLGLTREAMHGAMPALRGTRGFDQATDATA